MEGYLHDRLQIEYDQWPTSSAVLHSPDGEMQIFFFSFHRLGCIITAEILASEVCSPRRSDTSQVRLDGYMLRILWRRA